MGSYIIRKIIGIIPLLLIVSIIMFLFMNLLPGNVVDSILSEGGTVEQQQKLMERYGLDLPITSSTGPGSPTLCAATWAYRISAARR